MTRVIRSWFIFRIPRYFELKIISLGIALQLFTIDYSELPLFRIICVAALVRSYMNGLQPFESTIEQTTERMPLATKTITAATYNDKTKAAYDSCYTTDNFSLSPESLNAGIQLHFQ